MMLGSGAGNNSCHAAICNSKGCNSGSIIVAALAMMQLTMASQDL